MKYLYIITFIISFFSYAYGQYPKMEIDSLGNKTVIFTLEQARKIDRAFELLDIMDSLNVGYSELDYINIRIIERQDSVILEQKNLITKLEELEANKSKQIDILNRNISIYEEKESILYKTIANKNEEIETKENRINKLKLNQITSGSVGGLIIIGLIVALIMK